MKFLTLSLIVLGLLVDLGFSAPNPAAANADQLENVNYRLNTDVLPSNYVINLTPYFDNVEGKEPFTFDGYVKITLEATKTGVKTITLHQDALDIETVTINPKSTFSFPSSKKVEIANIDYEEKTNKLSLHLSEPLSISPQEYELHFKYTGKLRTDMHGFYRSSYKENGETKWLASTQMQPVYARKVFPCFDEPRFKATFDIVMNRPSHFKPTLSNTPLKNSAFASSNMTTDTFEQTPKMSTYLVAFIVSEFECRENDKHTFAVCSRPNAYNQTKYSFDVGQKILAKFDERFDYKYNTHMKKMAMVAIPDFDAGAMENWGLLTYREVALLYDPNVSTAFAQQRVASVVAHEQTHMWFGDLVTCDWWENTWLNEGFARFFEYFGTEMVEAKWGLEQQFIVNQIHVALVGDSLESTKALFHEVNTPDEIGDRFGLISYYKGGSVIRMFEHTFGHDKFTDALRHYLKTNALKTSVPDKLYDAFQDTMGGDEHVRGFMNSWVVNAGYPVLNVKVSTEENQTKITLTQKRFLRNNPEHGDKTLWSIPITFASNNHNTQFKNTKPTAYLENEQLIIETQGPIEWIVFNVQQTGYYRVNYDDATWAALDKALYNSHTKIHVHNRAQIVDDALNLARARQLNYSQALHTIEYLQNETDYIPWLSAFNNFEFILARFKTEEAPMLENFLLGLLGKVYSYLGFHPKDSDTRLDIYNRELILKYACKFGHEKCIANARAEFDKFSMGDYKIPVNLVPVVYCSVISEGSYKEWEYLWRKFKTENVATEQVTILRALGCTKQAKVLMEYLEKILSDDIRLQDKHSAFVSTLMQQGNVNLVLDFIVTNHQRINKAFESEKEVPSMLSQVAARSTSNEQIDKIVHFVDEHKINDAGLKSALLLAKTNLKWAEEHIPTIKKYLKNQKPNSTMANII
ncbi:membrane alanyl aminopeptidase-like [Contarinia nasturtii]|uniref:membrane alanyl aminopeptidase-like n=1 Tax=Contarinia nasturtii TaxID=265458 RepID=UPI0012D4BD60|nr:membrane alanyl aminopeptidase-like [Contarinia nasturtii]XP_031623814.1 membrane alanyl aminopeptidase-like [Contarinia nasturtii]